MLLSKRVYLLSNPQRTRDRGCQMNRDRLLDKNRALLSKTQENGCTEAEAFASLDKARALMDAYEVTSEELRLTKEEADIIFKAAPACASCSASRCVATIWRPRSGTSRSRRSCRRC